MNKSHHVVIMVLGVTAGVMLTPTGGVAQQIPIEEYRQLEARLNIFERLLASEGLIRLHDELKGIGQEMRELRGIVEIGTNDIKVLKSSQVKQYQELDSQLQQLTTGLSQLKSGVEQLQGKVKALENARAEATLQLSISADTALNVPDVSAALASDVTEITTVPAAAPPAPPVVALSVGGGAANELNSAQPPTDVAELPRPSVDNTELTLPPEPSIRTPTVAAIVDSAQPVYDPLIEQQTYRSAFNLLKDGHYEKASYGFKDFLLAYPTSEFAGNAQYWLGESFYVIREFESAMNEFQQVLRKYPQSSKLTHAMLKIGYIYHELGQLEKAKSALSELAKRYPDSTAASLARRKLQRISDQ